MALPNRLPAKSQDGQNPALLGCLDGIGAHALEVDPAALGPAGEDGLQGADAHLHRLLDHVVETRVLQGREQVEEIERVGLLPPALCRDQLRRLAAFDLHVRPPFPVPAVEDEDASPVSA